MSGNNGGAGGRPTTYTPEFGKLICERVATNPVGLSTLEKLYPDMPNSSTIKAWRRAIPEFSAMYMEAKKFQSEILVEDIDSLLPDDLNYYIDDKGQQRIDAPSASLLIAKINNRKWMAARLSSKLYGDRHTDEQQTQDLAKDVAARVAEINKQAEKDY